MITVFGLGHPSRGDDGVGLAVVDALARQEPRTPPDAIRAEAGLEPLSLLDLLPARLPDQAGRDHLLVVVDAVRTGAPPGTVLVRDLHREPLPTTGAPGSGHLIGLDQVLALAKVTDRLPQSTWLVGVEGTRFELGSPVSPPVQHAVEAALLAIHRLIDAHQAVRTGCAPATAPGRPA